MSRLSLILFVCFSLSAHGAPPGPSRVQIPGLTQPGQPAVDLPATIYRPAGSGPFPAVVVLHHCGGIDAALFDWASRLASQGYVSVVPDSFSPRGTTRVCATGQVRTADRVPDAYAAANYLRSLPEVRGDRIGLIGFSHGGGTITEVASRPPLSAPFRAAVAYYPGCRDNASTINFPTLILVGSSDDWTPAVPCSVWAGRIADPAKLTVIVYPGAYHKFDGPGSLNVPGRGGVMHHLQHDEAATADATSRTDAFLARWLKQ
jgi:dienelactone hydrolase